MERVGGAVSFFREAKKRDHLKCIATIPPAFSILSVV